MSWEFVPARWFQEYEQQWAMLNHGGADSILLDDVFIGAALSVFGTGNEVIGTYRHGNEILAMGIFTRTARFSWQTFQPANAPLGAWICLPHTPIGAALRDFIRQLPGMTLLVGITQQDPAILPPPASTDVVTFDYIKTARVNISGSFEEYWQSRGKNLRHNITRQRNRLAREMIATRLEIVTKPEKMAEAIADYAELETRGWKGKSNSAVRGDDAQSRFYVAILETYAKSGRARVWRYFFNDMLVASDICIHKADELIILKTTYNEKMKGFSPAQLMRHEALRQLFDNGEFRRIEFFGPVKDWHTKWTDDFRTMYHMNCYRWVFLKRLHSVRSG